MKWKILSKKGKNIIETLLKNRGIKTEKQKKEFFDPADPMKISLKSIGIKESEVRKAVRRIKIAKKSGEHVIIYGDYDADGITGTATMWETLHGLGLSVLPHIPERFSEGYGLNLDSVKKLKREDPALSLIITIDHGITAGNKVMEVKKLGIDMIVSDHHQMGKIKPKPLALIYTDKIGGSAIAWFLAREILKSFKYPVSSIESRLELAAIGTVADQLPLKGINRSIVKYGLAELSNTKRPGLTALIEEAGIKENIGTYEVGFLIAPRINSMGRLKHGIESLRLLCTKNPMKARELAMHIGRTNSERQRIVDEIVVHALRQAQGARTEGVIVLASESYHEGVIGLAAAKLVEEFYRPAIVLSKKGEIAKASARSIAGFNIIEAIRSLEDLYIEGGGHPMAAGFSIYSKKIEEFKKEINKIGEKLLTPEILSKKLTIDMELSFSDLTMKLCDELQKFEPIGLGNPGPAFLSKGVEVIEVKRVGSDGRHLKMKLKSTSAKASADRQDEQIYDSIFFGGGEIYSKLVSEVKADIVYRLEKNVWNNHVSLQLVIKDLRFYN